MRKVLITGIGGDIAQSTAKIIREQYPHIALVGTDLHLQHGGSLFVDKVYILPTANSIDYISKLVHLIDTEGVDVVIPMTEPELAVLGSLIKVRNDISWITAGEQVIAAGLDKLATAETIEKLGLPVPWTVPVNQGLPHQYPCILKNRLGSGSRAVFIVKDEAEALYLSKRYPDAIYQELLEPADREVTCAVYRTRDGKVSTLQMLRRLVGGFTGWATVINDDATSRMCKKLAEGLNLQGSMNVQLRITDAGPRVFEINPRISSTVLMRHQLGYTDVLWAMLEIEDKPINFPVLKEGQVMVRTQGAAILNKQAG
jgi:carbamoyl-phosphate synthase large subunit